MTWVLSTSRGPIRWRLFREHVRVSGGIRKDLRVSGRGRDPLAFLLRKVRLTRMFGNRLARSLRAVPGSSGGDRGGPALLPGHQRARR